MDTRPAQTLYDEIQKMEREGLIFFTENGEPDRAVLRSFACVAEFIGSDGERWLATLRWGMDGREPPVWETIGLMECVTADLKKIWTED